MQGVTVGPLSPWWLLNLSSFLSAESVTRLDSGALYFLTRDRGNLGSPGGSCHLANDSALP